MYAVLQKSLDQLIKSEALEDAVRATETLTKLDCPRLLRELFGIVASNLTRDEAVGMQRTLAGHGVDTEVVQESQLPALPPPRKTQSFALTKDGLHVVEFTAAQEVVLPAETLVFAAAGGVKHLAMRPHEELEWVTKWIYRGGPRQVLEKVKHNQLEEIPEFRVEFFFAREPYRFQWILDDHSLLRANGEVFRRRDQQRLRALLSVLAAQLPAGRINLGIAGAARGEDLVYPSVRAFEEEIVWSFYRLLNAAG
jgi:hypothetical protein